MSTVTPNADKDHRWLILVIVAIAQLMVVLDATVVNIARPSAQRALGFPNGDRQWIVTAYALAFGSLLLLGGRLGDMFSRKRVFITRLIGFAAPSAPRRARPPRRPPPPPRDAGPPPPPGGRVWRDPGAVRAGHAGQHVPRPAGAGPRV